MGFAWWPYGILETFPRQILMWSLQPQYSLQPPMVPASAAKLQSTNTTTPWLPPSFAFGD